MTFDNFDGFIPLLVGISLIGLVIWRVIIEFRERGKGGKTGAGRMQKGESFRRKIIRSANLECHDLDKPLWALAFINVLVVILFSLIVGFIFGLIRYFSAEKEFDIAFQAFANVSFGVLIIVTLVKFVPAFPALFMMVFSPDVRLLILGNRMQRKK